MLYFRRLRWLRGDRILANFEVAARPPTQALVHPGTMYGYDFARPLASLYKGRQGGARLSRHCPSTRTE
jgi:hypothetical protein